MCLRIKFHDNSGFILYSVVIYCTLECPQSCSLESLAQEMLQPSKISGPASSESHIDVLETTSSSSKLHLLSLQRQLHHSLHLHSCDPSGSHTSRPHRCSRDAEVAVSRKKKAKRVKAKSRVSVRSD